MTPKKTPSKKPRVNSIGVEKHIEKASLAMTQTKWLEAIKLWNEIIENFHPNIPNGVYARLASAYRKSGDYQSAVSVLKLANSNDAVSQLLYREICQAHIEANNIDSAISVSLEAAASANTESDKREALALVADLEAKNDNLPKAIQILNGIIQSYGNDLPDTFVRKSMALVDYAARKASAKDGWEAYWRQRQDFVYIHVCRRLIEVIAPSARSVADVGSNRSPVLDFFDGPKIKYSIDIENPYRGEDVIAITEDFHTWSADHPIDVGTCFQVIEHVDNPGAFCKRMLELFEVSIISVPFMEPPGLNPGHINNDISLATLTKWFGREPNFHYIATELSNDQRIICIFDNVTSDKYEGINAEGQVAMDFRYRWSQDKFLKSS